MIEIIKMRNFMIIILQLFYTREYMKDNKGPFLEGNLWIDIKRRILKGYKIKFDAILGADFIVIKVF